MGGLTAAGADGKGEDVELPGKGPDGKPAHIKRMADNPPDAAPARARTSQIWQNAFMDAAARKNGQTYDPVKDTMMKDGKPDGQGLSTEDAAKMAHDLTNDDWKGDSIYTMQDAMKNEIMKTAPVEVTLANGAYNAHGQNGQGTQKVVVKRVDPDFVYFQNGQKMPTAEFVNRLQGTPKSNLAAKQAELVRTLEAERAKHPEGQGVPVQIKWGEFKPNGSTMSGDGDGINGTHFVVVNKIANDEKSGKMEVYYTNPRGQEEHMPEEDFKRRLVGVSTR